MKPDQPHEPRATPTAPDGAPGAPKETGQADAESSRTKLDQAYWTCFIENPRPSTTAPDDRP